MGRPRKNLEVVQQKKVSIDGQQNCFVRQVVNPALERKAKKQSNKYYELQEKQLPNGMVYELVEVDYPITKESVKSYEESTRYTKDLDNNPKRVNNTKNLGDVTQMQEILQGDGIEAYNAFKEFMTKFNKYKADKEKSSESPSPAPAAENEGGRV